MTDYVTPASDRQLSTLRTLDAGLLAATVVRGMICLNWSHRRERRRIKELLERSASDTVTYRALRRIHLRAPAHAIDNSRRGEARVRDLHRLFATPPTLAPEASYLDLGGDDGAITAAVGRWLGLPTERTVCADVAGWYTTPTQTEAVTYRQLLPGHCPLPFTSAAVGFVTCFQSLHHIADAEYTLSEISRVLSRGGYLLLREHNVGDPARRLAVDVYHALFEVVGKGDEGFLAGYEAWYRSSEEWDRLCEARGLRRRGGYRREGEDPLAVYYALYERV